MHGGITHRIYFYLSSALWLLRYGLCVSGGNWISIDDILAQVANYGACYVTVTGGELLAQRLYRAFTASL